MHVFRTRDELAAWTPTGERAVVMTMGALHDGHAALMDEARAIVGPRGQVLVTIFVNPLQFGANEDFDAYPRTVEHDQRVCDAHDVDAIFVPSVTDMYGETGQVITVDPGPMGDMLEGAIRPGHFRGMLTVVAKLLHLSRADIALFGEKDYQQLVCIQHMVNDLAFPVRIHGVPTVREADGLAMSSRNVYLSPEARQDASLIPRALQAALDHLSDGVVSAQRAAREVLASNPAIHLEYLEIRDPMLNPATTGEVRILIAARIGDTRLIDNLPGRLP